MTVGNSAVAPDGVVHRMNPETMGGVICGQMPRLYEDKTEYWLLWQHSPVTCLVCLARLQ